MSDYERGFTDALELVVSELENAKDLEDARTRVELLLSLTLEHKMTELKHRLGCVAVHARLSLMGDRNLRGETNRLLS